MIQSFFKTTALPLYAMPIHGGNVVVASGERKYEYKPLRDLPEEEKPREKLERYGPEALSMAELLSVVFVSGTTKEEVLHMSRRIFKEYGEQAITDQRDARRLAKTLDIPVVKADQLTAVLELGRRLYAKRAGWRVTLRTARQVSEYAKEMHELPKENLRGLYLDAHYRLVHDEVVSIGSLTANIIHPREVFRPALERGASAVILVHNHPSGDPHPSVPDVEITSQIVAAGKIMGVALLDHVIVAKGKFMSIPSEYGD